MAKKIAIISAICIFLASMIYVIIESEKLSILQTFLPEKIATFKDVHMTGQYSTNESWEVFAKQAWMGRDKFVTNFEDVSEANIRKKGRLIVKGLTARRMRIAKNKEVEIIKNVGDKTKPYLSAYIDLNAVSGKKKLPRFSFVTAEKIRFNPDTKRAFMDEKIRIIKDDLIIRSDKIVMDLNTNVATFESRTNFLKSGSKLWSNTAIAFLDDDQVYMNGSIEVTQKNKRASSSAAEYNDRTQIISMKTNVTAIIEKPRTMIKGSTADKYKDAESNAALTTKTVINCEKLDVNVDNNDSTAYGKVLVTQGTREARADKAQYSEKEENIVMTGNVSMKRGQDWIKADKVIVAVDKERFEAVGQVETEFRVKKGSKKL